MDLGAREEREARTSSRPAGGRDQVLASVPRRPAWNSVFSGVLLAGFSAIIVAFLGLPLLALLFRVPLDSLVRILTTRTVLDALRLTAFSSLASLTLMIVFGTPVAYVLGRFRFRGKAFLETILEVPLILPPAVAGVALLFAFGRRTPIGVLLHAWNLDVSFNLAAVVLAQTFVAAPFFIKTARTGFQGVPADVLEAASTQGAGPWARFRHVVVPLAAPSLVGGAILGWARAVGEFGATMLFAGNFPGTTQTMPLAIYTAMEADTNAAIVLSAILVLTSFTVLLVFKLVSGRSIDVTPE